AQPPTPEVTRSKVRSFQRFLCSAVLVSLCACSCISPAGRSSGVGDPGVASGRTRWHEGRELPLQGLCRTIAPALRDGLRGGIGEDVLLATPEAIENAPRRRLGRRLRDVECPVHVRVDGPENDRVDSHALTCEQRPQRL